MRENQITNIVVLTLGQALNAGFIPDGAVLRRKDGASVSMSFLSTYSGSIRKAVGTGNPEFPALVEGTILHKSLLATEKARKSQTDKTGRKYDLVEFDDGQLFVSIPGYADLPLDTFDVADAVNAAAKAE